MEGADTISINSDLPIWKEKAWDNKDGVLVVVGVKRANVAVPFSVLLLDYDHIPKTIIRFNVGAFTEIDQTTSDFGLRERVFMFYNWQHKDVDLTLFMTQGVATLMYSKTGQKDYSNNIYSAVPMSE